MIFCLNKVMTLLRKGNILMQRCENVLNKYSYLGDKNIKMGLRCSNFLKMLMKIVYNHISFNLFILLIHRNFFMIISDLLFGISLKHGLPGKSKLLFSIYILIWIKCCLIAPGMILMHITNFAIC